MIRFCTIRRTRQVYFNKNAAYNTREDFQERFNGTAKKEIITRFVGEGLTKRKAEELFEFVATIGLPDRYPLEDTWNCSAYDKLNSIAVVSFSGEKVSKMLGTAEFKGQKAEALIRRVLSVSTEPGDIVMDSFLGTGSTAAVAQKMNRRWIGVEIGNQAYDMAAPRLKKVIDGSDGSGITSVENWKGGGGFRFYELGEAILKGDGTLTADIPFEVMAAHVWFTETKTPYDTGRKSPVLGVKDGVAYALLYNGILMDRRVNGGNVLTRKTLEVIDDDLKGLEYERLVVYAEASRLMPSTLEERRIEFKQTPYDLVTRK